GLLSPSYALAHASLVNVAKAISLSTERSTPTERSMDRVYHLLTQRRCRRTPVLTRVTRCRSGRETDDGFRRGHKERWITRSRLAIPVRPPADNGPARLDGASGVWTRADADDIRDHAPVVVQDRSRRSPGEDR